MTIQAKLPENAPAKVYCCLYCSMFAPTFVRLMHNDVKDDGHSRDDEWAEYIAKLQQAGVFQGGSAIGGGICLSKAGTSPDVTAQLSGFIRVQAESLNRAKELVQGKPVFEAGGTIEIRELPKT